MVKKLALIASKGTLNWAYPPFILVSTAAALDYEISIFFTFYGLTLLKKDLSDLKISPLANSHAQPCANIAGHRANGNHDDEAENLLPKVSQLSQNYATFAWKAASS
jgi:peroxiredoxin family protein